MKSQILVLFITIFVPVFYIVFLFGSGWLPQYETGSISGHVSTFSKSGVFTKSWEGRMTAIDGETFNFSLFGDNDDANDLLIRKIKFCLSNPEDTCTIFYNSYLKRPFTLVDSPNIVQSTILN